MEERSVCERMREDWNRRAEEDAEYYVAYGRRKQDDVEFFSSGAYQAGLLAQEFRRMPGAPAGERKALEIGCGMGRLMRHLSRQVGEIHGVDVSDEMVRRGCEKLKDVPNAHLHHTEGADLAAFPDESFDFVYSFAVFQHIPSREVIFRYWEEAARVLKPGGVFRFQVNGQPEDSAPHDTWNGVRIREEEIVEFSRRSGLRLMALEGGPTLYLWATLMKPGAERGPSGPVQIQRITNAARPEPVVPTRGRYAFMAVFVEELPGDSDLNTLALTLAGVPARLVFLGPSQNDGRQQLNAQLPAGIEPGLHPVQLLYRGRPVAPAQVLRVIPPGPMVPRVMAITDGVELLMANRTVSGVIRVALEEVADVTAFRASLDGRAIERVKSTLIDPMPPRFEIDLFLPEGVEKGWHTLELAIGDRRLAPVGIEVAG
jgi:ubiquinone/menaquinone biosynthesis C-methylase UbiE